MNFNRIDFGTPLFEDYEYDFGEAGEGFSEINRDIETAKEKENMILKKYLEVTSLFQYIVNPQEYVQVLIYQQNIDLKKGITYPFPVSEVIERLRNELGL